MFPLSRPAAMMHLTVLVSLLTVRVCSENTTFSQFNSEPVATTTASYFRPTLVTSPAVKTSTVTPLPQTTTRQNTADVMSASPLTHQNTTSVTSASPTTTRTEEPNHSTATLNTATSQSSNWTTPQEETVSSELRNVTETTNVNTTNPALSTKLKTNNLAENPGLVAIICIFSIVLALMMVVVMVKCVQAPRSNFERLEDVPMGKVNEESPFAHYSK